MKPAERPCKEGWCRRESLEGAAGIIGSVRAQVHMAAGDHAGLIEACARLGDVSRGGDPHLWTEVLQYFGAQQYDCTPQVCVEHKAAALHSTCLLAM